MEVIKLYSDSSDGKAWHLYQAIDDTVPWDMFLEDERTSNIVFYMGPDVSFPALDSKKINIYWNLENPGNFFSHKRAAPHLLCESKFDYIICPDPQTYYGRKDVSSKAEYIHTTLPFDYSSILKLIDKSEYEYNDIIDSTFKDIDVFCRWWNVKFSPAIICSSSVD